jgi:hypothetical protein
VERLVAACQVAPTIYRNNRPNTMSFLFTEIMNDGAFRGTLRGLSMNFLQLSFVLWPSALVTNKAKGGIIEFMSTFLALSAILHPIDTIKNNLYGRTQYPCSTFVVK